MVIILTRLKRMLAKFRQRNSNSIMGPRRKGREKFFFRKQRDILYTSKLFLHTINRMPVNRRHRQ